MKTQGQTLLAVCFQACKLWDSFQCLLKYSPPHFPKQVIWKYIENDSVSVEWMWSYSPGAQLCIDRSERCSLQEAMLTSMSWVPKSNKPTCDIFCIHWSLLSAIGICSLSHHWHYWFILMYYLSLRFFKIHGRFFHSAYQKPCDPGLLLPLLIPHFLY